MGSPIARRFRYCAYANLPSINQVVATPFVKFFDLGCDGIELEELYGASVRWEATEKLDGSMGLLFEMRGQWRLITKRAWDSEQARRQAHAMALATCTGRRVERSTSTDRHIERPL